MPKTTRQLLVEAREFLSDEGNWIKDELSEYGACCALGAVTRAYSPGLLDYCTYPSDIDDPDVQTAYILLNEAAERLACQKDWPDFTRFAAGYNDHQDTTHADVLEMFDLAIEAAA